MTSAIRKYFSLSASEKFTVGDTKTSMTNTDHLGWLLCDGRQLLISDYQFLFNVLGTHYGGDGVTNFNLPNPAGRVIGIKGSGAGLTTRTLGASVGEETHQLIIAEMPSHTHTITDPGHTHTGTTNAGGYATTAVNVNNLTTQLDVADNGGGGHTHSFTTNSSTTGVTNQNTGGDVAHNNMQPTLFVGNMFVYSGKLGLGTYPFQLNNGIVY